MSLRLILSTKIIILLALPLSATVFDATATVAPSIAPRQVVVEDFVRTKIRDMDDLLGRDFNWKEKLVLRIVRKKLRRAVKKNPALASHQLISPEVGQGLGSYDLQQDAADAKIAVASWLSFGSALLGSLLVLLNALFGGILLLLLAVVMGAIGLVQIRRQPERYKGKGLAWFGIVVGSLGVIAFLFVLALVLIWLAALSG